MANIFGIPDDIRQFVQDGVDDLLNEYGHTCTLYFKEEYVECTNCVYDPIGKKSANRFITGGPMPFPRGSICPMCSGSGGVKADVQSATITLWIEFDPVEWRKFDIPGIRSADGLIFSQGFMKDLPSVRSCTHMRIQSKAGQPSTDGHIKYRYTLASEPIDDSDIVQGRYFTALWKRNG